MFSTTLQRHLHRHTYHHCKTGEYNTALGQYGGRDAAQIFGVSKFKVWYEREKVINIILFELSGSSEQGCFQLHVRAQAKPLAMTFIFHKGSRRDVQEWCMGRCSTLYSRRSCFCAVCRDVSIQHSGTRRANAYAGNRCQIARHRPCVAGYQQDLGL